MGGEYIGGSIPSPGSKHLMYGFENLKTLLHLLGCDSVDWLSREPIITEWYRRSVSQTLGTCVGNMAIFRTSART
ncbi:hypothetical protein GECvBMG_gp093c [Salmonella phage GEC_vB_MG]|nr:hypothetical protein GECvBMG_gp093c [Salmonella phage GEC_vB_MG]